MPEAGPSKTRLDGLRDQWRKARSLLGTDDVRQLRMTFLVILTMAFLEVAGIASILPFMYLVAEPQAIENNALLNTLYTGLGFESHRTMLTWTGAAVLLLFTLSTLFSAFTTWFMQRTVWSIADRVSVRLLDNYARLPFQFFLEHNTSELLKKVISDVSSFVSGVIAAGIRFVAYGMLSLSIVAFLLLARPGLAIAALLLFGGAHVVFHVFAHGYFRRLGEERLRAAYDRFHTFSDAITGIKAIRTQEVFPFFRDRFARASRRHAELHPRYEIMAIAPRFGIELLAFGAIVATVLYWLMNGEEFVHKIPVLTLFALAAYRLLPALNTASISFSQLTHNLPVIDEVCRDFNDELLPDTTEDRNAPDRLRFETAIELRQVKFGYRLSPEPVISGVDLRIPKGADVALVGTTGSGKSTLMDILVGLLLPVSGSFNVDGQPITDDNAAAWRRMIAYVPQDGFLYDASIAENIAFGTAPENIDIERARIAARIAQIDDFISTGLPDGYATRIGERGVRLSGGQRQRVGLARAFYRRPSVLLLDEATSALDNVTENAVMAALREHLPGVTIIMVAHRLSTVRKCDCIHLIEQGRVAGCGTFAELYAGNAAFRLMVDQAAQHNGQSPLPAG